MAETVLAKLAVQISANTAKFGAELKQARTTFTGFINNVTKLGGAIGLAFGVQQVASFALEVSRLAGEFEGVSAAFERLPNSERLMQRLKDATHDTVSELDLMKRAVQASNFDISLEALPRLLEFATLRAQQTGQSVDYLVDSIVTGIGRKSKLILDNLGISAVQLNEALGGASTAAASIGEVADAVGRIAEDNLKNMAAFSNNAATKIQQLQAEFVNLKVAIGTSANDTGLLAEALDDLILLFQNLTTLLNSDVASALENYIRLLTIVPRTTLKVAGSVLEFANELNSLETAVKDFNDEFSDIPFAGVFSETKKYNDMLADLQKKAEVAGKQVVILSDDLGKVVATIKPFSNTRINLVAPVDEKVIITIDLLNEKLKELTEQFRSTDVADRASLETTAKRIIATRQQIEELEKLLKVEKEHAERGIEGLRGKLAELNKEYEQTDIHDTKRLNSISQEIQSISSLIDSLERLRKKRDESSILSQPKASTQKLEDQVLKPQNFDPFKTFFDQYGDAIDELHAKLYGVQQAIIEIDLGGLIGSAVADIANALGEAAVGVGNFGSAILKSVIGFAKQLGGILIAAGTAMLAVKLLVRSPGLAIAAGFALVAIAGAANAALNRSQQGFNSGSGASQSESASNRITETSRTQTIKLETSPIVIRGEDMYVILKNYENGRKYTHG